MAHDGSVIVARLPADSLENADILRLVPGQKSLQPVVVTQNLEGANGLSLSPDGRWLAYASSATGNSEIWVQPYPGPGAAVRVSPRGGREPVWARNGRELFYRAGDALMSVAVPSTRPLQLGERARLLDVSDFEPQYFRELAVGADGRFLLLRADPASRPTRLDVIVDWFPELTAKAGGS